MNEEGAKRIGFLFVKKEKEKKNVYCGRIARNKEWDGSVKSERGCEKWVVCPCGCSAECTAAYHATSPNLRRDGIKEEERPGDLKN